MSAKVRFDRGAWWVITHYEGKRKRKRVGPTKSDRRDAEQIAKQITRAHRFALGGGYRDLWQAEIELPLVKLETPAGTLVPTGRFGGQESAVLGLRDPDGRVYSFRGTDKDPSAVLPHLLQDTIVQSIVQDQMAAQHPGAVLVADVISEAAGVLTIRQYMAGRR